MQTCYSNCSHARVRRFTPFSLHSVQIVRTMLIISVFSVVEVGVFLVCTGVFVSTRGLGTWLGECAMMGQRGKNNIFAHELNQKNAKLALQVSVQLCTFALNFQKSSYKWRRFSNHTPI